MNQWHGIIDRGGQIDALICPECYSKFPFKLGLAPINDIMGALDRKCACCPQDVADWVRYHAVKEAA
jgi:hypothetical protein